MKNALLCLIITCGLGLLGCSDSKNPAEPAGTDPLDSLNDYTAGRIAQASGAQAGWFAVFDSLIALSDTASALDALVARILADPGVASVGRTRTGVTIAFKDGMRGALLLRPHRLSNDSLIPIRKSWPPLPKRTRDGYVLPDGKKTLFLSAMYDEFKAEDDQIKAAGNEDFKQVEYAPFEFITGSGVSVSRLLSLGGSDYSFIRISSHGFAWPSDSPEIAIEKIYLVTGEVANLPTSALFGVDIRGGGIATVTSKRPDKSIKTFYMIDADLFGSSNSFGDSKPFLQLAFCYSGLGGWPQKVIGSSRAGGCTAFDWSIAMGPELSWSLDFLVNMCDTTRDLPCHLKQWYSEITPTFFDPDYNRIVSIHYYGDDSLAFWQSFRLFMVMPSTGKAGDTLQLAGKNFGDTVGRVIFDATQADQILDWNDSAITVIAPDGFSMGTTVEVKVIAHQDTTNPRNFCYQEWTINYGEFKVKVWADYTCSGDCSSDPPCPPGFQEFWAWGAGTMQGNTFTCLNAESGGSGIESFTVTLNPADSTVSIGTYSGTLGGILTGHEECAVAGLPLTSFYTFAVEGGADGAAAQPYVTRASSSVTGGTCTTTLSSYNFSQLTCGVHIYLYRQP